MRIPHVRRRRCRGSHAASGQNGSPLAWIVAAVLVPLAAIGACSSHMERPYHTPDHHNEVARATRPERVVYSDSELAPYRHITAKNAAAARAEVNASGPGAGGPGAGGGGVDAGPYGGNDMGTGLEFEAVANPATPSTYMPPIEAMPNSPLHR